MCGKESFIGNWCRVWVNHHHYSYASKFDTRNFLTIHAPSPAISISRQQAGAGGVDSSISPRPRRRGRHRVRNHGTGRKYPRFNWHITDISHGSVFTFGTIPATTAASKAPEGWRTPRRFARFASRRHTLRVLDCGGPPPLFPEPQPCPACFRRREITQCDGRCGFANGSTTRKKL